MNDLERDLKDLFDTKARAVGTTPAAPETVLRRGRRRQIGVAIGGALAGIAVLAVASVVTLSMLDGRTDLQPAVPDGPYGARTAVIEGFQVQAPAGWTLMDQWALANVLATSRETCTTFATVGTVVGGSGQTVGAEVAQATGTDSGCSTAADVPPAIVPVLQLSTFDPGLMSPVCDVFDEGTNGTLPSDGVAVFVAALPEVQTPEEVRTALTDSCAATPDIVSIVQGSPLTYVTATFAGADADPTLLGAAPGYVTDLGGHDTRDPQLSPLSGPAYIVGSGVSGDEQWQVSVGIALDEGYAATAWMTSFELDGGVLMGTLAQPWNGGPDPVASALDVGDSAVAIALMPAGRGEPIWETNEGLQMALEQTPFPDSLSDLTAEAFIGSVAWGEVPSALGHLVGDEPPGPSMSPTPTEG